MSAAKFLGTLLLLALLAGAVYFLFPNVLGSFGKGNLNVITLENITTASTTSAAPDWCQAQEFAVPIDQEVYGKNEIIGWDNVKNCCVQKYQGWNCALKDYGYVEQCFTSNLGGEIVYADANGVEINASKIQAFINDLMKDVVPNKPCYLEKYPEELRK
jgi:hypothetical protein